MQTLLNNKNYIMETLDNSNLLRGLLLLITYDKNIWDHEVHIFLREGIALGYDKEFCKDAIHNVLGNYHLDQTYPVFFYKANALKFLKIGISIIEEDLKPHHRKIHFLEKVASANDLTIQWNTVGNKIISLSISSICKSLVRIVKA